MQLIWASHTVMAKYAMTYIPPSLYVTIRTLIAAPILLIAARILDKKTFYPARSDIPIIVIMGLAGIFGNSMLYMYGLKFTYASIAGVLQPLVSVFTLILSVTLKREKINLLKVIGLCSAIGGTLVVLRVEKVQFSVESFWGPLLLILSFVCYAVFLVLQKPLLERMFPLSVVAWAITCGSIPITIWSLVSYQDFYTLADAPLGAYAVMVYAGLFSLGLAYVMNVFAMRQTTPTVVSSYGLLLPLLVVLLSILFIGEPVDWHEGVGGLLTVIGLATVILGRHQEVKQSKLVVVQMDDEEEENDNYIGLEEVDATITEETETDDPQKRLV